MKGDSVYITASPEDIETMLKLNNFQFAGANLTIERCESSAHLRSTSSREKKEGLSQEAQELQTRIQGILASRYDGDLKLLNLSALGQDAGLVEMGMLDGDKRISKLFPVLMAICDKLFTTPQAKRDAIESITLADNELVDLSNVAILAQTFPDLKNLDLSRNKFADLKALDIWRWKFRELENLVMSGNPIEHTTPAYNVDMLKWYPKLSVLSGIQVRTTAELAAEAKFAEMAANPIPISGPRFHDVGHIGENFIRSFLSLYDTDRMTFLSNFYDAKSQYSLAINMTAPRGSGDNKPRVAPWAAYTKHSRNMVKMTYLNTRMARNCTGNQAIQSAWSTLPVTRHPDLATQLDKYILECQPISGLPDLSGQNIRGVDGLMLTIHGEFEEPPTSSSPSTEPSLRSFSRTFVLGPGAPGEIPVRVVSDTVVLRAYAPIPKSTVAAQTEMPVVAQSELPATDALVQQQQAMAMQLVEKTGMTPDYSLLCLNETGWDLEKAFAAFMTNKVSLSIHLCNRS